MRPFARASSAAAALVVAATLGLSGCTYLWSILAIRVPDTTARPEQVGSGHRGMLVVPHDSVNAEVARMRGLDAISIRQASGERQVFSRVSAPSVRLRHDSLVFVARRRPQAVPLAGGQCVTFVDHPPRWPLVAFTGAAAALGGGLAILGADGRASTGRVLGGAAIGTAIALPVSFLTVRGRRDSRPVLVLGEGPGGDEAGWGCSRLGYP